MTYNTMPEDYNDLTSEVGSQGLPTLENKNMNLSGHTWRTIIGLAIVFIIGGLSALKGVGGYAAWIDMVLPVLLVIEHAIAGKTE